MVFRLLISAASGLVFRGLDTPLKTIWVTRRGRRFAILPVAALNASYSNY